MSDAINEADLVAALRRNEEWAFEAIIRIYGGRLLSVARRYVRTEADAHDVLQTAYLNAFRAVANFEGSSQLSTWLHRIVVNTALMRLRTCKRRPEESIEDLLPSFLEDGHHVEQFTTWTTPADVLLEQGQTRQIVRRCIDQLPEIHRTVLLLRDIEERSAQEVADALMVTPAAVKVRLHRARQALATLVRQQLGPGAAAGAAVVTSRAVAASEV